MQSKYNIIIMPNEEDVLGYWATCDMPNGGVIADGETIEEVKRNINEAIHFYLEDFPEIKEYH
jgi:predicted RNase H-like HicB family nuclease